MKQLWSAVILLSVLMAGLVNFVFPDITGRPIIVMWFLFVCPGMTLIRFFHLDERVTEWTLGIALSFVLDVMIASIQMYSGHWSPPLTLGILMGICTIGTLSLHIFRREKT
jgi:hypothetical protein